MHLIFFVVTEDLLICRQRADATRAIIRTQCGVVPRRVHRHPAVATRPATVWMGWTYPHRPRHLAAGGAGLDATHDAVAHRTKSRLFEPFVQHEQGRDRSAGGLALRFVKAVAFGSGFGT
jgi:hypothetical protein